MTSPAIIMDNIGKRYKIGMREKCDKSFREAVADACTAPFRRLRSLREKTTGEDTIWALKDVSFQIQPGQVVGIIGRNGAGKSTLLKILSRITEPTTGRARIRGRIGSLLEVGTGFHPELTGQENIYLNGAILGMKKAEIDRKFDRIVAFAEVDKFLNTPVKRYSSGMRVRLAFAVAAHLDPEILLVDEVLAVGDAAFQKKCLGKMEDVSKQGRTVLFVSHNMSIIQKLCSRTLHLSAGSVVADGDTRQVVENYLAATQPASETPSLYNLPRAHGLGGLGEQIRFTKCSLLDSAGNVAPNILFGEPFAVRLEARSKSQFQELSVVIGIESFNGDMIASPASEDSKTFFSASPDRPLSVVARFNDFLLTPGVYWLTIAIRNGRVGVDQVVQAARFEVLQATYRDFNPHSGTWGYVHTTAHWERADSWRQQEAVL